MKKVERGRADGAYVTNRTYGARLFCAGSNKIKAIAGIGLWVIL
jgi:hypothetical protein